MSDQQWSGPRVRRGRMAADQFTQISNKLARDPRLSFKAKGIFVLIASHREGWGITIEQIAKASKDGVSAVRAGLNELEAAGYLYRTERERREDGTLGSRDYVITDDPESAPLVDDQDD